MKSPIIRPYAEIESLSQKALDAIGFRFTALDLDKTKDGWLRLYITWRADKDEYKVKYPCVSSHASGRGSGQEYDSVEFEFPQIAAPYGTKEKWEKNHKASIDVGIYIKTGRVKNPPRLGYSYKFKENIKYGALVWFAPESWNSGKGDKNLFAWNLREKRA